MAIGSSRRFSLRACRDKQNPRQRVPCYRSEAHAILIRAAALHPGEGLIQFNLGCYEWQLGNLVQAKAYLKRATKIDAKFKQMALDDFDLKPLWASLAIEHTKAKASSRPLLGRKGRLITLGPRRRMWGRDPSILRRFSRRRQDHCRR